MQTLLWFKSINRNRINFKLKKEMRMSEKKHIILTNIDTDLWRKFKGVCYTNGKSMNHVVSQLITQYIQRKSA